MLLLQHYYLKRYKSNSFLKKNHTVINSALPFSAYVQCPPNKSIESKITWKKRKRIITDLFIIYDQTWMSCGMYGVGCSRDHRDYEDQVPRHTHLGRKEKGYGSLEARRKESFLFRVQREGRGTSSWEEVAWLKLNESIISKAKKDERIILSRADRLGTDKDNKDHLHKLKAAWFGSSTG